MEKGLDGSCPLGPVLVSPSAIGNPHNLQIKAIHNGNVVQDSNTRLVYLKRLDCCHHVSSPR